MLLWIKDISERTLDSVCWTHHSYCLRDRICHVWIYGCDFSTSGVDERRCNVCGGFGLLNKIKEYFHRTFNKEKNCSWVGGCCGLRRSNRCAFRIPMARANMWPETHSRDTCVFLLYLLTSRPIWSVTDPSLLFTSLPFPFLSQYQIFSGCLVKSSEGVK